MPRADPIKNQFIFGEIAARYKGQPDSDIYKGGVDFLQNYFVSPHGAIYKRQGTRYLATAQTAANSSSRLFGVTVPNTSGSETPFIFEVSNQTVRIYDLAGTTVATSTTTGYYTTATLYAVNPVQVGTRVVLFSPFHEPYTFVYDPYLASWSTALGFGDLASDALQYGPFLASQLLDTGVTDTTSTLTPSGTTGTITLTKSGAGSLAFTSGWVRRFIRFFDSGGNWRILRVTAYTSSTQVTCTVLDNALASTTGSTVWALGVYCGVNGHAGFGVVFQNRLYLGGCPAFPDRIDASEVGDFAKFRPFDSTGTVQTTSSFSVNTRATKLNSAKWLDISDRGVLVGTENQEFVIDASDGEIITPTTAQITPYARFASTDSASLRIDKTIVAISRSRANLKETRFTDRLGGLRSREVPFLDETLTLPSWDSEVSSVNIYPPSRGIAYLAHSSVPDSRLWFNRTDGYCISSYIVDNDESLILAPSRFVLGGSGGVSSAEDPKIISIASVQGGGAFNVFDYVVFLVQRRVNGATVYYIEALRSDIDPTFPLEVQQMLDCHKYQEDSQYITSITNANPGVVTTAAPHGWSNGDRVRFRNVFGMTGLGTGQYQIANVTATTFELNAVGGGNTDTTGFGTFAATTASYAGMVVKCQNTVTGLTYLNGETVSVWADGAAKDDEVVSGGSITLDAYYGVVIVGYKYLAKCRLLRQDSGSATGTALGKTQRSNRVGLVVDRIVDLKVGRDFNTMYSVRPSQTNLYSGVLTMQTDIDYELGNRVCIQQNDMYPGTILAVMPSLTTQDR